MDRRRNKKQLISFLLVLFLLIGEKLEAQNVIHETFSSTRLINLHTSELLKSGFMEFRISHRFGSWKNGWQDFAGLDQATIRLGLEYGVNDWLMVGIGRSTYEKTVDGFLKTKILSQKDRGMPLTLAYLSSMTVSTLPFSNPDRENLFSSRLAYVHQLILASKLTDRLSLQISPTIVHKNLVKYEADENLIPAIGVGGKYSISKPWAINIEYIYRIPQNDSPAYNTHEDSFSLGATWETRGHFFSFHVSNSSPMIEKGFITETIDSWGSNNLHLGFNILRDFKINKKRK